MSRSIPSLSDFRFFSHPFLDPFQFSLAVLFRYRFQDVFRVGGRWPPFSQRNIDPWYSGNCINPFVVWLRDYHPLRYPFPGNFTWTSRIMYAVPFTTSLFTYINRFSSPYVAFARRYSRHLNWFLFLRLLRCFNSPRSPSQCEFWLLPTKEKSH
jgi:hypothetical protein